MKPVALLYICTLLLALWSHEILSQDFIFDHIEKKDGLSHETINDIYQDEKGMMWFATRNGLNRYDGNNIHVFNPIPDDSTSIPASTVSAITGDNNGHLYLTISGKLVLFDIRKESFTPLPYSTASFIHYIKDKLLFVSGKELYWFTKETDSVHLISKLPIRESFRDVLWTSDSSCWIGTNAGLYYLNSKQELSQNLLSGCHVRYLIEDKKGSLWICTENKGLIKREVDGKMYFFRHEADNPNSIVSDFVRTACFDHLGFLWLGSPDGLSRLDTSNLTFHNYYPQPEDPSALSFKSINKLYTDKQGTVWIGTYFRGINYLNPEFQFFKYYHFHKNGLGFPVIGKMTEDKEGTIWMCTSGGYLNSYNPGTNSFHIYDSQHHISNKNLKSIYYDQSRNCLWLGSADQTLDRFDLDTKKAKTYRNDKSKKCLLGKRINQIVPWNNQLLLGTGNSYLTLFDPETGETQAFVSGISGEIGSVLVDCNNDVWIAASGVYQYKTKEKLLIHHLSDKRKSGSLSSNIITSLFEDSKQTIWIGTAGFGLNRYKKETNDFEVFTKEKDGLLDNNIHALGESPNGKILIGTNSGLSTYNPREREFLNYDYRGGFPLTTVNDESLFVSSNGVIYLGGVPGITMFSEDKLQYIHKPFTINFTRLYLDNEEVTLRDKSNVLSQALPFTNEIDLFPEYSGFSVEFTTDNYIRGNTNEVEYRLKGYDGKWIEASLGRLITYTNLSPGKYVLELRAKKNQEVTQTLTINVIPPFYRTTFAYIVYLLAIFSLVYWLIHQWKIRFYLKASLEFEKKEKKRNEEMIQSKLRFFTDISHEIRTPVTLIIGQLENLLQSYSVHPKAYDKMLRIHKNALNLKVLISELLDFRKQEQEGLNLKISEVDLVAYLEEIYFVFQEYALSKKILFEFLHEKNNVSIWIDTEQIKRVMQNLLSNAFKNTPEGGTVVLSIAESEREVSISITDNGYGIPSEELNRIFERFYQAESVAMSQGTGIGLALSKGIVEAHSGQIRVKSKNEEGTTFTVVLKKGESHFSKTVCRIEQKKEISLYEKNSLDNTFVQEIIDLQKEVGSLECKLLIVEDNDDLRSLLSDIFSPFYNVETAEDGLKGWEKIKDFPPDIIISDIMMPNLSGVELCAKIKNNFETSHIPVILLTAKTMVDHKLEGLRIGADDYITKPFDMKLLVARCNNLVNNRKILQKKFSQQPSFSVEQIASNSIDQEFVEKAGAIAEAHLGDPKFDIDLFARKMGMGRTSFFNKLKGVTGMTPLNFISNIKLKKAVELLMTRTDMNVADIAYYLGYSSPGYFNECFKDLFGYPPLTYKKIHQEDLRGSLKEFDV